MLQGLQKKWKVNGTQLFLILCVFAVTGTTTAYITRQVTTWLHLDSSSAWFWILKILVLIFGYQVLILLVSVPFGQFSFFWNYEKKILRRLGLMKKEIPTISPTAPHPTSGPSQHNLAIFASGTGTNAQKIIDHFHGSSSIHIVLIVCNNPAAGVLQVAQRAHIPTLLIDKEKFFRGNGYVNELKETQVDFIVLAGFLWKIPLSLINAYPKQIINLHPALLPKYGGKGMYGQEVHQAVLAAGDHKSGITIHYVDAHYDNGDIIFQAECPVLKNDDADTLATRIHELEHANYPTVIEQLLVK